MGYRGYSHSSGTPSCNGLKIDGSSVLRYALCSQTIFDRSKVLIHGTSLGAGVGLHTLANNPLAAKIKGIIVENTFTSLNEMADMIYPKLKVFRKLILRNFWDNDQYVTQLPTHSPSFAFFCNYPRYLKQPYRNYLENQLRQHFKLTGVPISIYFRKK